MAGLMSTGGNNKLEISEHTYQEFYNGVNGPIYGSKSIPVKKGETWLFIVVVYAESGSASLSTPNSTMSVNRSFSNRNLVNEIVRICTFTADTTCEASLNGIGNLYDPKGYFIFVRLQ